MSARKSGGACRVPVSECAVPAGEYSGDALKYLADRNIEVLPDHRGRLSVAVADAQALWNERAERAAGEVAKQAELRSQVANANQNRLRLQEETFSQHMRGISPSQPGDLAYRKAVTAAANAVRDYDKTLPRAVRDRLDALPIAGQNITY
jgi:hypothetical protein